jgi:putative nucleotidyltransferase with HDIG domain
LYEIGIIANEDSLANKSPDFIIKIIDDHQEKQVEIGHFLTLNQAYDSIQLWCLNMPGGKKLAVAILENIRPNITYNGLLTQEIIDQQLKLVSPVYGLVNSGEKIIDKGEIVTPEIHQKLISLQEETRNNLGTENAEWYFFGGMFIYIVVGLTILVLVIKTFNPPVYSDTNSFTLLLILFWLSYAMANLPRLVPSIELYALPFALFAVILQSFFRNSLASIMYMLMIFIASLTSGKGTEFIWIEMPAGLLAILLLTNLRKRSQMVGVISVVFVSSVLLYLAANVSKEGHLDNLQLVHYGWFGASALLMFLSIPIVFLIERIFGLVSEMALMELSDTNNTLLRELAQIAPGTFQHSLQVANLAEECALQIGGDALLVRTAALYHDIGKMENPSFFIENQSGGHNPHLDLTEEESAQIIIHHVIAGVELAKKHKLPEKIIDFIRTHHGTTTTRYFLHHAQQKDPHINVENFRYPGPLPFSKETAILMLCDGVEAAARSLKEYTAQSISQLIDSIFTTVLESQQLEHAPITFEDITTMKKLLQKKVMNIYHIRVAYPTA